MTKSIETAGTTTENQSPRCRVVSPAPRNSLPRVLVLSIAAVTLLGTTAAGFSLAPSPPSRGRLLPVPMPAGAARSRLGASASGFDGEDDDDDRERVPARVRRRRGRAYDDDEEYDDDRYEPGGRRGGDDSIGYAADRLEEDGIFDEMDDDDEYYEDDDLENDESYDTFSNTVIPNQLLDSIDPDGSAERFSEIATDPKFWFDMVLFITVLDLISFIGPRNPFQDVAPEMYTAGLPPPGM
ncbi:unnamed protein product [Pseudo-nitzschia multistriata]|uniref:Uncharacterized protein n=1 Tax=Pseudo-nitzschia multistriata TaxID=183589 RepID=A0A448Z003_9STRA|nr:unnamed protein product [Pseudo-nitzschia multistriata]